MKLFFYSSFGQNGDRRIDSAVAAAVGPKGKLTFIPAASGPGGEHYFEAVRSVYRSQGLNFFEYLPVDCDCSEADLSSALMGEAIFLSGGNTFSFLKNLQERSLLPKLREFAQSGGVLIGQSAGSIIMTSRIDLAGIGPGADPNFVGLKDLSALSLVNFEFLPHYDQSGGPDDALERYSVTNTRTILCAADQSGVAVEEEKLIFFGDIWCMRGSSGFTLGAPA